MKHMRFSCAMRSEMRRCGLAHLTSAIALAVALPSSAFGAAPAEASDRTRPIIIVAQPLATALIALSRQTGISVFARAEEVAGKSSPAIKGAMTPQQALNHMLQGTGLGYSRNADGTFMIEQARPKKVAIAAAPVPARTVAAQQPQTTADSGVTGIAEIVVTAQKRGENLQRVPIAITAISAESLQARGITNVLQLTQQSPNIYASPYTVTNSVLFFFMRGMGTGDPTTISTDPSIGVYENGIYNPRPTPFVFDLLDPERIEVLRGPQGTLYGRNTTGGAMNIVSRVPKGEFEVRQLASYASRNQYRSVTNVDLPSMGGLKLKGTLAVGGDDGFAKNIHDPSVADTNDFGIERHIAGRIAARWDLSDNFTADYGFTLGRQTSTGGLMQSLALEGQEIYPGIPYRYIRDKAYRPAFLPLSYTNIRDHGLTLEWRPSDTLTLRSITGIRYYASNQFQNTMEIYFTPFTINFIYNSHVLTQEFQAVGSAWDDRVKYAAGLFYFRENATYSSNLAFPFGTLTRNTGLHSVSKAAYAQLAVTPPILNDRLDITLGVRQTWDKKDATRDNFFAGSSTGPTEAGTVTSRRFNPAVTVAYRWSDSINSYAKVATGYRAGGFDEQGPVFTDTFRPESLTSYEIGLKSDFFDRRVRTNFAAFYNNFKDIQLPLAIDPTNVTLISVRNAGIATIKGLEADITIVPVRDLTVNVNYAYLSTNIKKVQLDPSSPNIADLFVIPFAPKHSLGVSGDLVVLRTDQGPLTLHADYSYKTSVYQTAGAGSAVPGRDANRAPSQSLLNGRVTLERTLFDKPAQISVFVKNALNSRKETFVSANGSQSTFYFAPNFLLQAPRTIGVEVSFGF